jgi:kynurenine formamidase
VSAPPPGTSVPEPHNWGRWGPGDQRGTLNLLTPDVVKAAVECVRDGRVLPLAMPIKGSTSGPAAATVPHLPHRPLPQHFMSVDGGDYAAGSRPVGAGLCLSDDAIVLSPHGTTTHLDALCHVWAGEKLYNGHSAARVRSYGATRCGIDNVGAVVARGVLLDVAGHTGVSHLDGQDCISPDLLAACAEERGVDLRAGDVVLIRTGWPVVFSDDPQRYYQPQPGLSFPAGRWLAERDIAVIGADNAAIAGLDEAGRFAEPLEEDLHLLFLWRHGIHMLEMLWLEELAVAGRAEFLFVLAPLAVSGGTASPVTPLAVL